MIFAALAKLLLPKKVVAVAKLWLMVKPVRRLKRWRNRKRMESWLAEHGQPVDEVLEDFNSSPNDEVRRMLSGKLTYLSVAALACAWLFERFGVPVAPEEVESLLTAIAAVAGTVGGLYGRWRATR